MKRIGALVAGIAAVTVAPATAPAGIPEHPGVRVAPPAAWVAVHEPAVEPLRDVDGAPPAVRYLALDFQVRIDGPRSEEFFSATYRVENRAGIESASQYEITFDPSFSSIVVHRIEVYRDRQWRDRMEDAFVTIAQRESDFARQVFDGSLSVLVVLDDIRVGDVISIAFSQIGTNPVFGDRYFVDLAMGWSAPVEWRRVRALLRSGQTLHSRGFGDAVPATETRELGDWTELLWLAEDLPEVEFQAALPEEWEQFPWLQLTQHGSWSEVVDWAVQLYAVPEPVSAEVAGAVGELAAGGGSENALDIIRWVQDDIRYFGIELGAYSHEPHPPGETVRRRYGDCKDKALLLIALLRHAGFSAWPVLVDSAGGALLPERLPSPALFDHVIVLARIDGRDVWIDPTVSLQGGSLDDLWIPDYGWGLVVRPGESGLTEIPEELSHPGSIDADYDYVFDEAGTSCEATITTTYLGRHAEIMRSRLAGDSPEALLESYVEYYSSSNAQVVPLAELVVDDARSDNTVTIVERYSLQNWWYPDGDQEFFDLLPLLLMTVLETCDAADRQNPFDLPRRVVRSERVSIEAPDGWDLEPVRASGRHPWFRYRVEGSRSKNTLQLEFELETFTQPVPPDKVSVYNAAVDQMHHDLEYTIFRPLDSPRAAGSGPGMTMPSVLVAMLAVCSIALVSVAGAFWLLTRLRFL